jgi:glycosyltransferase involved in cell wall biosynthesis
VSQPDLRILIVAEHASAAFGGEAFLPLHYFRVLRARGVEAWLLCHGRVEAEVRALFPQEADRLRFIPDLPLHRWLWRLSRPLPELIGNITFGHASHLLTQVLQRQIARRLIKQHGIDVVHEPIPVSPKQPSAMFDLGAPVVIGPMNGGMDFPPAFQHMQSAAERASLTGARNLAAIANRLIPGKLKAAVLLVANERTRRALPRGLEHVPVIEVVENGVDLSRFHGVPAPSMSSERHVRYVFVGRLIELKAVDALLDALKQAQQSVPTVELDILGDGEVRAALEAQTTALGLGASVRFHGFVTQDVVAARLREADALILPSLRECGGAVVLEAMAMGVPVIATRWGGPADYLDDSCGVLIDLVDRPSLVRDLARAMIELARDPERRSALGRAGRQKVVTEYDWERKVDRMLRIYADVRDGSTK